MQRKLLLTYNNFWYTILLSMKKTIFIAIFALMFVLSPAETKAFQVEQLIDPFCLFACDTDPKPSRPVPVYNPTPIYYAPPTAPAPIYSYSNNYIAPLSVSCYTTFSNVNVGDSVVWRSSIAGGTGNYNISWSGSNGLTGIGPTTNIQYNSSGSKTANVTVVSGGQTISKNCGNITVYSPDNYYDNNDNNYNNYDDDIVASCYPNYSSANVDETVTWRSSVHGGNGDYNIRWSGTEGFSDSGSSAKMTYDYSGTKRASITVRSGGRTITKSCSTLEVYGDNRDYNRNYDDRYYNDSSLTLSCSANTTFAPVGTRVTWQAYASGGSGSYTYRWSGSDSVNGYSNILDVIYNSPGSKIASVTVTSRGKSITQACSNTVLVGTPTNIYQNTNYQAPNTVIKYVEVPAKNTKPAVAKASPSPTPTTSLFSLSGISWGWVSLLVILVLMFTVVYLIINKTK
jgi:hypothetical protein